MPKIRVLTEILASQVAAGEVVERPASVVKELVENSIDAGAREVRVEIHRGGAAWIRVDDDGCGMSREDALLSLERHATSKLRDANGLAAIRTLGFRGEAVPSIASVSRFRMVTREADAMAGTEILVDGGTVRDVREAGCAPGTTIECRALFYNMPARRKFLRAESTESAHVEHQLRLHALAAPQVRFRLRRDERDVFDLPAAPRSADRIRQLIGIDLARELVALPETRADGIEIEGFVLPAAHARKGRRHQCVFLNGRPVEDAVISRALAEGFRGAVAEGLHPAAWLWITMDPTLVDVNVHPSKREVRFHRPLDLREAILGAVTEALKPPSVHTARSLGASMPMKPVSVPQSQPTPPIAPIARPAAAAFGAAQPRLDEWIAPVATTATTATAPLHEVTTPSPTTNRTPSWRMLGMLAQRFVLLESEDGLVLLDPKAAHERILYEALMQDGSDGSAQPMLVPILLEFDPRDADCLVRERQSLAAAGIDLESFGGNTVQIRSLPSGLETTDPRAFLSGVLDELLHDPAAGARFTRERIARTLAARAAASITPRLAEALPLLGRLFACSLPFCTADGRPTLTEYSISEVEKRFGIRR
jgi:DNA mismatch repair protein MutL